MKLFPLTVLIHFITAIGGTASFPSVQEPQADSRSPNSATSDSVSQWLIENVVPMDAMTTDAGFASILESARVMGGFEMMIWMVEENRMLLDELRAWNAEAEAGDRVEIIGIDVQSAHGAAQRLQELLEHTLPELALEAGAVAEQLVQARNAAYGRDLKGIAPAQKRLAAFIAELSQRWGEIALRTSRATPTKSCVARASSLAFRSILRCATMA